MLIEFSDPFNAHHTLSLMRVGDQLTDEQTILFSPLLFTVHVVKSNYFCLPDGDGSYFYLNQLGKFCHLETLVVLYLKLCPHCICIGGYFTCYLQLSQLLLA